MRAPIFLQMSGLGDELAMVREVVPGVEGTIDVITNVYGDVLFDDSTGQFHLGK